MSSLLDFLKEQENAPLAAGDESALVHPSPEGGLDTVGFGHKLTPEEVKKGEIYGIAIDSLTLEDAEHILKVDVAKHQQTLDKRLKEKYGIGLKSLSPRKRAMLTDYEFNLGNAIGVFPSFVDAVITDNEPEQASEMVRTFKDRQGNRKPLARNKAFYNTFMSSEAKKAWGE